MYYAGPCGKLLSSGITLCDFVAYTDKDSTNPGEPQLIADGYVWVLKNRFNNHCGIMTYRKAFGYIQKLMKQRLWSMEAPQMSQTANPEF